MNFLTDLANTFEFLNEIKRAIQADIVRFESGDSLAVSIMKNNQWLTVSIDETDTEEIVLEAIQNYDWSEPSKVDADFELLKLASQKLESYKEFLGAEIVQLTPPNKDKGNTVRLDITKNNASLNIHIDPDDGINNALREIDEIFERGNIATKMYSASFIASHSQGVKYGSAVLFMLYLMMKQ